MRPRAGDGPDGAERADGQGRSADGRQGSAHRRLRLGHPAAGRAAGDRHADDRRHGAWRSGARAPAASRVSFIGEGGSSLGEWHEAINLCAARRLPAIFCIENNQTALSTPVADQSAVRVFADKAVGYGIPGITIDGTDPDAIAAAFAWAAERARARRRARAHRARLRCACAATRTTTTCCISASDPQPSWDYPPLDEQGYADRELLRVLGGARSDRRATPRGSRPRASSRRGDLERLQARGRSAGRGARRRR